MSSSGSRAAGRSWPARPTSSTWPGPSRSRQGSGGPLGRGPPAHAGGPVPARAVSAYLDTNVLIRHLTGDPPGQAARATRLLSRAGQLLLPDLIVAELVRAIVAFPAIEVADEPVLLRALEVYKVHRLDFADAYLVAEAETSGVNAVASFDRAIERVPTVRRVEPQVEPSRSGAGAANARPRS
jgi:predicted nucleic acid-binding protein